MRYKLETTLDETDNIIIKDPTSVDWKSFEWTNGYYIHRITKLEIMKPYLISFAYYNTLEYEDLILLLNNIADPFEMITESEIYLPKIEDIKTFILKNRK